MDRDIIDPSIQKGFLSGIDGVIEHILSLNCIINNSKTYNLPLFLTFIDLRNAFGSFHNDYIRDMLTLIELPSPIFSYVSNLYTQLSAFVTTRQWATPNFKISRGVFQGDTLSPLLFLLCFQPVITFANSLPYGGFRLQLPLPNSTGLPPIDSHIYVEWCEDGSSELPGWYHCRVVEFDANSLAVLIYRDGATAESINLHSIKWEFACKNGKPYLAFSTAPPIYPLKKQREAATLPKYVLSASHKAKAYADDLTILSTSKSDHQLTLSSINGSCQDLGLEIRPDKCVSYCFDGQKPLARLSFQLLEGCTSNISTAPTKFSGETLGITPTMTKRFTGKKLCSKIYDLLTKINERPIRGEYKVWIYKCYLIPSVLFNLTVDKISPATSKKIQYKITSYLKKWIKLPRATLASLFHPDVLNLPYLPHQLEKAKLRLLASPFLSSDHNIQSLVRLIHDTKFIASEEIPLNSAELIQSLKPPLKKNTLKFLYKDLTARHAAVWNTHLESLTVQRKFIDLILLESESRVWSQIITSLPAGQLSFLLRAGIDCLPTPVILSRWRYQCDSSCKLPLLLMHSSSYSELLSCQCKSRQIHLASRLSSEMPI